MNRLNSLNRLNRLNGPPKQGGVSWSAYWATRKPSALIVTGMRDTEIDFSWTDNSAGDASFKVYKSTDGVTYAADGTTVAGDTTYTATGMTAGVVYYFYVVGVKSTNESDPTNIYDTRFKITIDTTKAGSANDTFILPTTGAGSYDYYVDWGDGGAEEHITVNTSQTHDYNQTGEFQIMIRGTFPQINFANTGDKLKLISIDNWGNIKWLSTYAAFKGCSNMEANYSDILNTSGVTIFDEMFMGASKFNGAVNFDTSEGLSCRNMLRGCPLFNQDISGWNFDKMQYCAALFYDGTAFNQPVNHLCTSEMLDNHAMFAGCANFNQPVNLWDTSNVFNMDQLFKGCIPFNQSVANFDTSNVGNGHDGYMWAMFQGCASFNQSVENFDTSHVTRMDYMFSGCTAFNQSLANFDTSNVTDMSYMFYNCTSFKQDISNFDVSNVTNMEFMFYGCNINTGTTTTNYDNLLTAWAALTLQPNVVFNAGAFTYYGMDGITPRATLTTAPNNWTITDAGGWHLILECVSNGGFADTSKWTAATGWEISGGTANYNGTNNAASLSQTAANGSNRIWESTNYDLTFTVSGASTTASIYILSANGSAAYIDQTSYANGVHNLNFTTPANIAGGGISFYAYTAGSAFSIDDISLIEHT